MTKRTNIVLDAGLVRQGMKATGIKTQRALVHHALSELVRREKQMGFLALKGKVKWTGDLNKMRRYRFA
ncbi:MAG TPA: type II toxin-antitoxin system VapB family antitoxin [Verrucomicrobiae bacterium]